MLRCDFCEKEVESLRRIALDKGYDRLSVRHNKMYACDKCSEKKDKERKVSDGDKDNG